MNPPDPLAETMPDTLRALAEDCRATRAAVARIALVGYAAILMAASAVAIACLR